MTTETSKASESLSDTTATDQTERNNSTTKENTVADIEEHPLLMMSIKPPEPLNLTNNKIVSWKIFKKRWQNYVLLADLQKKDMTYQIATLENCLGDDAIRLLNGFAFESNEDQRTVQQILEKFEDYAIGEVNETMERFIFHQRNQQEGEDFENFLAEIRRLALTCKFCKSCSSSLIRDRIVLGISDNDTREALLKEKDLTLNHCIDICKAAQSATSHTRAMTAENISTLDCRKGRDSRNDKVRRMIDDCRFCGTSHIMDKNKCPAFGETCDNCGGKNHFARKCRKPNAHLDKQKRKKHTLSQRKHCNRVKEEADCDCDSSEDFEFCQAIQKTTKKLIKCRMIVDSQEVVFQIDTGASVNLLPAKYCSRPLDRYDGKLMMWNNAECKPLGTIRMKVKNPRNGKKYSVPFLVYDHKGSLHILGNTTSQQMGLVTVEQENFESVANILNACSNYSEVFDGSLGQLPGYQSLTVRPNAVPTIMAKRRIPIAIRPKLKEELDRLTLLKVIVPEDEPTPWVSQIVVTTKKSGKLRVCIDPHELNKALLREHYTLPILDDVLHNLRRAKVFTKVDLASGYWHIKLDEESSKLTTFQTCFGRYRWLRLPFGLNVSSEIFQKRLLNAFEKLNGVECIADDVIIHGETKAEHDKNLNRFLERCKQLGVRLNKDKTETATSQITFMGHLITTDGVHIDPEKVKAVNKFETPSNVEELRRFLGMVNYVARFLPNLTTKVLPLHNLLKKDICWNWSEAQQKSFETVKSMLTKAPVLAFYSPDKKLILENDASEYGLGSVMLQDGRPIAYASRALSQAEKRYAQIEKEMLAIVYGLEKFHQFTYGRQVHITTDHKPLVAITRKPLALAPRRLQNLLLKAMNYNYEVEYKSGKDIPVADALSRAPYDKPEVTEIVNDITVHHMSDRRLEEIRRATAADRVLMDLGDTIMRGWPSERLSIPEHLRPYMHFKDELAVHDGIIMKGDRVVIPTSLRMDMKQKLHTGHLGVNSCLRRAKDVMYWPGMTSEIRQYIETCGTCSMYQDKQAKEENIITAVPVLPWQKVAADLCTWGGRDYIITTDYHSNFIEFDPLPDIQTKTVIMKLKMQFARHGIPECLVTDNGGQFTAEAFKDFTKQWNIHHETISPGNSKANGAAESAVKIFKRLLRKSKAAGEDPFIGLLNMRNTPTAGMTTSPVQRLMGRRTRTMLPMIEGKLQHREINSRAEAERKEECRVRETMQTGRNLRMLEKGETVRIQPYLPNSREWKEGTVEKQITSRSYEVVTNDGKKLRRNRQHLRQKPKATHSHPATSYRPAIVRTPSTRSSSNETITYSSPKVILEEDTAPEPQLPAECSPAKNQPPQPESSQKTTTTRSGRMSRPPVRYTDSMVR